MLDALSPIWINSQSAVERLVSCCRRAKRMALDTEADSLHSYFHKVCLIQVSAGERHFVIDPLAVDSERLAPLFEVTDDPGITTLLHGSDYDLRVLDRDFGARIRGLEDTQVMAQLLGEPRTGLATLLENELGITLDKRFQRADWGKRPLPDDMLAYAAADTAFLHRLADRLRERLERLGRWSWAREEFEKLESVRYSPPNAGPLGFERIKGARALKGVARDRLATLYQWRDGRARELDRPPFKVLGNHQLLELASTPVRSLKELQRCPGVGGGFARRWGREVLAILHRPEAAPPRERRGDQPVLSSGERRRLRRLTAARDAVASSLGLEPGILCSRAVLTAVACHTPLPASIEGLEACGVTGWRLEVLAEQLLAACEETDQH
ncbi:MAG: HRDC domain-containing protein [Acidobacteria bacterium]|nr:HRDC domain-containing protein [Acidobacteriota bacterium]